MVKYICINGAPRAGKDSFVELCQKHSQYCINISTVDCIKEIARKLGWDGTKTPRNRKFLSDLKDLLDEWDEYSYKKVIEEISRYREYIITNNSVCDDFIFFIHAREPKDIQKFKERLNVITLFISNKTAEAAATSNHADANVKNFEYDYVIENNSTLEDLETKAIEFLKKLKEG